MYRKLCTRCGEYKDTETSFYFDARNSDSLSVMCIPCMNKEEKEVSRIVSNQVKSALVETDNDSMKPITKTKVAGDSTDEVLLIRALRAISGFNVRIVDAKSYGDGKSGDIKLEWRKKK